MSYCCALCTGSVCLAPTMATWLALLQVVHMWLCLWLDPMLRACSKDTLN
jgi:hypothetical protein